MSLADDVAGLDEVAGALGRTRIWLVRNWLKIHERDGFPRKHPTGMTWPRRAVQSWLRTGGLAPAPVPANDDHSFVSAEAAFEAELLRHYGVEQ